MKKTFYVILFSMVVTGCHFSKSVNKDLITGLTSTGNGLTCEDVNLMVNDKRKVTSSFSYGEKANLVFNDVKGFKLDNGKAFPLMQILVTSLNGDTVLFADDLYSEYADGMDFTPLKLTADLTVATPIKSGSEYQLKVFIKDRKGSGTYTSKLKFSVGRNDKIKAEPSNVSYDEIYLFSVGEESGRVINDGKIKFGDAIYLMVEGLKGFKEEDNMVFPGLSLKGTDSGGSVIFNYEDLFSDFITTGISVSDFITRISAHFVIKESKINNLLHLDLVLWDRKSEAKLRIETDLIVN
jgi:hypothetical protein